MSKPDIQNSDLDAWVAYFKLLIKIKKSLKPGGPK